MLCKRKPLLRKHTHGASKAHHVGSHISPTLVPRQAHSINAVLVLQGTMETWPLFLGDHSLALRSQPSLPVGPQNQEPLQLTEPGRKPTFMSQTGSLAVGWPLNMCEVLLQCLCHPPVIREEESVRLSASVSSALSLLLSDFCPQKTLCHYAQKKTEKTFLPLLKRLDYFMYDLTFPMWPTITKVFFKEEKFLQR